MFLIVSLSECHHNAFQCRLQGISGSLLYCALDTCACRVEAEAVAGLEVVAGVLACCNGCTFKVVPTLNELCKGFANKKGSVQKL